jgi:hypothetical protein
MSLRWTYLSGPRSYPAGFDPTGLASEFSSQGNTLSPELIWQRFLRRGGCVNKFDPPGPLSDKVPLQVVHILTLLTRVGSVPTACWQPFA